jgi:dephospho-CoA kinase
VSALAGLPVVGVTGGIASGKSAVTRRFEEIHHVPVVDTDLLAREVVAPGSTGLADIVATFGLDVLLPDGSLDRRSLRQRVFADPAARRQLEHITHPRIRALALERLRAVRTAAYALLVVPLLAEGGGRWPVMDRVLVVDVDPATQRVRLVQRDGIDAALADAMIAAQATRADRLALADDVLANDGTLAELLAAVDALHARYLDWARAPGAPSAAD